MLDSLLARRLIYLLLLYHLHQEYNGISHTHLKLNCVFMEVSCNLAFICIEYTTQKCCVCAHLTNEFAVIPEVKPRDNQK